MALTKIDDRGLKTPIELLDDEQIRFGTGNDLKIYHDGSNSYLWDTGTGDLHIMASDELKLRSDNIILKSYSNDETFAKFIDDGASQLYYDHSKKFETTSGGAKLSGDLTIDDSTPIIKMKVTDDAQSTRIENYNAANTLVSRIYGGTDGELRLETGTNGTEDGVIVKPNGAVELYHDGSKKFETNTHGIKAEANLFLNDSTSGNVGRIKLGDGADIQIFHNGTNSYIDSNTGNLYAISAGDIYLQTKDSEASIYCYDDGAVELYYDGDRKLRTISSGVHVESSTGDTYLSVYAEEDSSSSDSILRAYTNNNQAKCYLMFGDSDDAFVGGFAYYNSSDKLYQFSGNASHWCWDSSGNFENNSDSSQLRLGASDDIKIFHDGTNSHITNITGKLLLRSDELKLQNGDGTDTYLKGVDDGSCELYYDNSKKLETTSTGVNITGGIRLGGNNAANECDDYEEGTWTPALSFNANTGITYDTAGADATGGTYTKIGRQVTVHGTINLTSKGSSTGDAKIHGLPFSSSGDDNNRGCGSIGYVTGMNLDGPVLILEERGGNTWFYLRALNANFDGSYTLTSNSFTDGSRFFFSYTYNVS